MTTSMNGHGGRTYAGQSAADRRAVRREQILEAALTLINDGGMSRLTVERVCRAAGQSTRAVYQEYGGREALIEAVYVLVTEEIIDGVLSEVGRHGSAQVRIAAALRWYVLHLTSDERRARVHAQGRVLSSLAERRRVRTARTWEQLVGAWHEGNQTEAPDPLPPMPVAQFAQVLGAISEVMAHWLMATDRRPSAELADQVERTFTPVILGGLDRARTRP